MSGICTCHKGQCYDNHAPWCPATDAGKAHIVALSGGKDSTALALRLIEIEPRDYLFVCTPTGNELPEMEAHWQKLGALLGKPLHRITNGSLAGLIYQQRALPNWRMRWCTRMLKIEPFQAFVSQHLPCVIYVGLRADEDEREGVEYKSDQVTQRYPLREWGWGVERVRAYLAERCVEVPRRTDCAACFFQTLAEWYMLWREHPKEYAQAEAWEEFTGHTLRSPQRDTQPAGLAQLRKKFEAGYVPKGRADMRERKVMCAVCAR